MIENKSVLTIPHNFEAEQAVLGSIIYKNDLINKISDILTPNSFHSEHHRHIFRAVLELADLEKPIDEVTLGDQLKSFGKLDETGGYSYLAELVECVPSSGNIVYYAEIIKDDALLRDLISTTNDIGRKSRDPQQDIAGLLAEAEDKISQLSQANTSKSYQHVKHFLKKNFERLEEVSASNSEITGIPTGYIDLDKLTSGLQPSDLIILAARPSVGKTALALNIASYVATRTNEKGAVLVFSLEMSGDQLSQRLASSESKINSRKLRNGNIQDGDWNELARATDKISSANLYIDDRPSLTPFQIKTTSKRLNDELENGVSLIIVDYFQLMESDRAKDSREQQMSHCSRSMKGLAKDLNIPVIALSQLTRACEKRDDKRPMLSDLRESGSFEQDADLVWFLYRDEMYYKDSEKKGMAELIIAKHRNGPTGMIELMFNGPLTSFYNLSKYDSDRF